MATVKTFISFATRTARDIVRRSLEPFPLGLTSQNLYKTIHKQFPDAKENPDFLPPSTKLIEQGAPPKHLDIPHYDHPIRSMNFMKKVVLEQMLERDEVEYIYVKKEPSPDRDGTRSRVKVVAGKRKNEIFEHVLNALDSQVKEEWRWRLVEGHQFVDTPDPSPLMVRDVQSQTRFTGYPHGKSKRRTRAAYVPPHDRAFGLPHVVQSQHHQTATTPPPRLERK
ncbi:hypothetical protein E1B28_004391 [Marasmius oreades]|uniref:Uncharacterized protein n=1 Tax=Marasmius oreades TaxID=181124 RepID=A0A9P7UYF6_9AGAR|nr:uncharacterized protein E1B28_004391 [Marasmius oreades]KAG7096996.1 hypothetical protein E1B28_004391 [Marasmius oreades]